MTIEGVAGEILESQKLANAPTDLQMNLNSLIKVKLRPAMFVLLVSLNPKYQSALLCGELFPDNYSQCKI